MARKVYGGMEAKRVRERKRVMVSDKKKKKIPVITNMI